MNWELTLQWVIFCINEKPIKSKFGTSWVDDFWQVAFRSFSTFYFCWGVFRCVRFTTWVNEHEIKCGWVPDDCARDVSGKSIVFWSFWFNGKSWIFMEKLENFREFFFTKALKKPWINWKFVKIFDINCTSS